MPEKEVVTVKLLNCVGVGSLSLLWIGGGLAWVVLSPSGSPVQVVGWLFVALGVLAFAISLTVGIAIWKASGSAALKADAAAPTPEDQQCWKPGWKWRAEPLETESTSPKARETVFEAKLLLLMAPPSCLVVALGLVLLGVTRNFTAGLLLMGAGLGGLVVMAVVMSVRPFLPGKEAQPASVVTIAVASLGVLCLVLGWVLLGNTSYASANLALMGLGGLGVVTSLVIGAVARWKLGAAADATSPPDQAAKEAPAVGWIRGVALVLFFLLVGVPFWGYMIWLQYSHRPRPDTVGYVKFYAPSYTMTFDLPEQWRVDYHGRNAHYPNGGRITDDQGQPRLVVYAGVRGAGDLEEYARREKEAYQKAGIPLAWAEFRETPHSRWWVYSVSRGYHDSFFGNQELVEATYVSQRGGLLLEFTMPAAAAKELEPLVWRLVQTAEVGAAEG